MLHERRIPVPLGDPWEGFGESVAAAETERVLRVLSKRNAMDALEFLIARKWPSSRKVSLALLAATALTWLGVLIARKLPLDASPYSPFYFLICLAVGLLGFGTFATVLALVPLYTFNRVSGTLQSWIRQRAVEEMLSTGMTARKILDALGLFGVRWWIVASLPGAILGLVLFPELRDGPFLCFLAVSAMACINFVYFYLSLQTWSVFPGGRALLPALVPLVVLPVVGVTSLLGFGVAMKMADGRDLPALAFIGSSLVTLFVARWLAIYGLENWESLGRVDSKTRRAIRRRLPSSTCLTLSENPICAREAMRGMDAGQLTVRVGMLGGFVAASSLAFGPDGGWALPVLLGVVVLLNSYRGAQTMSQIVTQETESSTLETVRSTPMNSEQFLHGWLRIVVWPQWRDHTLLILSCAAVAVAAGHADQLLNASIVIAVAATYTLPLVAAYVGASIAGQAKTRSEISGQLAAAFAAVGILGGPQSVAGMHLVNAPSALGVLTLMIAFTCWVLDAGAKKSLNRVFLPQR